MYKNFFGFKEKPFSLAPNPEYLYLGKSHDKTMAHLLFTISYGKKSLSIFGELGTGKTTLCKAFFGNLDESVVAAYISAHKMDAATLLKAINYAFSIDTTPNDTKGLVDIIYEFLIKKRNTGQKALVLIDEAQNLPLEALEQILLLANLETAEGKLLKIILVGQPELGDMLSSDQLKELGQLIIKSCQLAPLTFPETIGYIEHHISLAAHQEGPPFDEASCRIIYEYSGGIPKLINIACEMALMNAFHSKSHSVTEAITRQAIKTLTQEQPDKPERRPNRVTVVAILSAFLVSVAIIFLYSNQEQLSENAVITKPANQAASVPAYSKPVKSAVNKLADSEKPQAVKQSEPGEIISEGGPKLAAVSEPAAPAVEKQKSPEKPQAVNQNEAGATVSETSTAYSVHVGTFNTASKANLLLNDLRSRGFPSFGYTSLNKTGNTVHVIVAGKYQSYDLAKETSRSLNKKGINNFIAQAKDSLKIPAGSGPIDITENKRTHPETPLAADQRSQDTEISDNNNIYSVHAGTFNTASKANTLLNSLKSLGFPSFMYTSVNKKGNTVYVVVAGKYQSYELAKKASHSLSKKGHSNFVARAKDSLNKGPTD